MALERSDTGKKGIPKVAHTEVMPGAKGNPTKTGGEGMYLCTESME
jgi:hypothetical protein